MHQIRLYFIPSTSACFIWDSSRCERHNVIILLNGREMISLPVRQYRFLFCFCCKLHILLRGYHLPCFDLFLIIWKCFFFQYFPYFVSVFLVLIVCFHFPPSTCFLHVLPQRFCSLVKSKSWTKVILLSTAMGWVWLGPSLIAVIHTCCSPRQDFLDEPPRMCMYAWQWPCLHS